MSMQNKRVAFLATNGFEEVELTSPWKALEAEGVTCHLVAPVENKGDSIRSWQHTDWGEDFKVDMPLSKANPDDYHMLILPGGVLNPDNLRMEKDAIDFIRSFFKADKPVAAICHGAQTMIEAGVVEDRVLTSYPSIKTDLKNAGANWHDREVVIDRNLVTSRSPRDLDAFNAEVLNKVDEAVAETA